jgi:hypothetical protein
LINLDLVEKAVTRERLSRILGRLEATSLIEREKTKLDKTVKPKDQP